MARDVEFVAQGWSTEAAAFARRCAEFGRRPTPGGYADLFHEDGTMLDAEMTEPITKSGVAESLASFVRNLPDFRIQVLRYLARGSVLYMLCENTATFRGERIAYCAVYAPLLRDGLVLRGGAYTTRRSCWRRW